MKKRILVSLLVSLLLAGGWREAQAQSAPQVPGQLLSLISFDQVATASPTTFTLIESLASYRTEVYQLRLWALDSLVSFKLRTVYGRPAGGTDLRQGDVTGWMQLSSFQGNTYVKDVPAFSNLQAVIPDVRFAWIPYHFRTAPGARLQIELSGLGLSSVRVSGFAQFIYRPVIR